MVNLHSCYAMVLTQLLIASAGGLDYKFRTGIAINAVHVQLNKKTGTEKISWMKQFKSPAGELPFGQLLL